MDKLNTALEESINDSLINCILSDKKNKLANIDKVKIRPVIIKNEILVQITESVGNKVIHKNLNFSDTKEYIRDMIINNFKQCQITTKEKSFTILSNSKGNITVKGKFVKTDLKQESLNHNRKKEYILKEGSFVPFLHDLNIMTSDGKIVNSKYDKFRQINRFLEFIEDIVPKLKKDKKLTILDFGCGKSYLTFAMYYYLSELMGLDINIIGLDLKEDVINECNRLKDSYGYDGLNFIKGDISEFSGLIEVDMVVTLHACDTATDYAIQKAINWGADVILSVPCCQHEVNNQIESDLLNPILKYGILKERISALITDGIRAELLSEAGYDTQILEFIDMEHTPKNLLIRAVKSKKSSKKTSEIVTLFENLHLNPTLFNLLKNGGMDIK